MRPFDYARADDPAGAVAAVAERPGATYLAGGTNLVDHLKLGITAPDLLVATRRSGAVIPSLRWSTRLVPPAR